MKSYAIPLLIKKASKIISPIGANDVRNLCPTEICNEVASLQEYIFNYLNTFKTGALLGGGRTEVSLVLF